MPSDSDIEALASDVLREVVERARLWSAQYFYDTANGEAFFYGEPNSFRFEFISRPAIKQIIAKCQRQLGETPLARDVAAAVSTHLIASLGVRISAAIDTAADDCEVILNALVAATMNKRTDLRRVIRDAGEQSRVVRETFLNQQIDRLPQLTTSGPGRPPVTAFARKLERAQYIERIEAAYRRLTIAQSRKPTKTQVAAELGTGGINPRTGSDTRLPAFNNKLRRLRINYAEIASRIEKAAR